MGVEEVLLSYVTSQSKMGGLYQANLLMAGPEAKEHLSGIALSRLPVL